MAISYSLRKSKTQYVAALTMAGAYFDLGDKDRTLDWLDKAFQERSVGLYLIAVHPWLDNCGQWCWSGARKRRGFARLPLNNLEIGDAE
jgi:hypothetical protein